MTSHRGISQSLEDPRFVFDCQIVLKFDRCFDSTAAEAAVKRQRDAIILTSNLTISPYPRRRRLIGYWKGPQDTNTCNRLSFSSYRWPMPNMGHDDVIKWKHFPRNWPFVWRIHRSPVNSLHKGQWRGALMFSLICVWINDWVNNREAGDLRRYRAHSDVIVMGAATVVDPSIDIVYRWLFMMTSSNGNIFRVTGPWCGEITGQRWIPRTKDSDAELWCFLWSSPE